VREIGFASAFSFKYSPRPGTKSAERIDDVPDAEKTARLRALQALLLEQQNALNRATIGRRADVLFEKPGRHPGQLTGKSPWLQAVHVDLPDGIPAESVLGRIWSVDLLGVTSNSLQGSLVAESQPKREDQAA
jgi:tRNA-2-methylthio-N6-dimethylallyladenosine synthase